MPAQLIDGKQIAKEIRDEIKIEVSKMVDAGLTPPGLGVIIAGDDPASRMYVNFKEKACAEAGIYSEEKALESSTSLETTLELIEDFNQNPKIHGILVQLPLPPHIDCDKVILAIDPKKDVDGFHPISVGRLWQGKPTFQACTPMGVMELLSRSGVECQGKNAVIVGRSNIVGKPMAALLIAQSATVTICHSKTKDLPGVCREADILVAAVGRPKMVHGDWIKPGATVIDVGINRIQEGEKKRLVGDVDFESAKEVAGLITPVPGAVGPMTIAMLLKNTLLSAQQLQV